MIRDDGFKLIVYPAAKVMRLYDLTNDPLEMNDIVHLDSNKEKITTLFGKLVALQLKMDDELDLTSVFPKL